MKNKKKRLAGFPLGSFVLPRFSPHPGFALSSLETTLKNWRNPKNHQGFPTTWQSLGLILSMVTVGADMVDPSKRSPHRFSPREGAEKRKRWVFNGKGSTWTLGPPRVKDGLQGRTDTWLIGPWPFQERVVWDPGPKWPFYGLYIHGGDPNHLPVLG